MPLLRINQDKVNYIRHYLYNRVLLDIEPEEAEEIALEYFDDVKLNEEDMKEVYSQDNIFKLYQALKELHRSFCG